MGKYKRAINRNTVIEIHIKNETERTHLGRLRAFQNGSARTRIDADASTHKKGEGRHADASDEADADQ